MMDFYQQYPMMKPYVGDNWHGVGIPSLLIIGESHYLEEGVTVHLDPDAWYSGSSAELLPAQLEWIDNSAILKRSRAKNFSSHAHFRNAFQVINDSGPRYADFTRVADDIAYYNFFLRPALEGVSLDVCAQDVVFANEAFITHFARLKPTAVIFLSMKAFRELNHSIPEDVAVVATPHPSCAWWNKISTSYGNRRGQDILADFITKIWSASE
jgi:hypothetical protein